MDYDKKSSDNYGNLCTILGGALLGMGIVDEVKKNLIPEIQKLISSKDTKEIQMLSDKQDKQEDSEHDAEKTPHNEIAELKRKLSELEEKRGLHNDKQEG